jgi:hypothetical protein
MSGVPVRAFFIGAVIVLAVCEPIRAQALPDSSIVQFFPTQHLFPRLLADGTSHQLGVSKDLHSRLWLGTMGAQRPLLQLSLGSCDLQAGIGATVQTSFLRTSPLLQVVTVDFLVDFPVDIRLSPLTIRMATDTIARTLQTMGSSSSASPLSTTQKTTSCSSQHVHCRT